MFSTVRAAIARHHRCDIEAARDGAEALTGATYDVAGDDLGRRHRRRSRHRMADPADARFAPPEG
jgi:hypothetical protein